MTESRRFDLVAFSAPGSIEAEVVGQQARLFAEHGLASSQALPPLVPVCFLPPGRAPSVLLARVSRSAPAPIAFRSTGMRWEGGWLYLMLESAGAWRSARAEAEEASQGGGPFPCVEGFFLGCGEASAEERGRVGLAGPDLRFTSCTVSLVRIECLGDSAGWWRQLWWEVLDERPLRVRRQR